MSSATAEATAAPPAKVTAAAAATPPPPLSPADIEQFAQSLKAYAIGWVSSRLAAADAASANDDGGRSSGGGDALLASLAGDFPFLGAALGDRDPSRLKALAAAGIPDGSNSWRAHVGGGSVASTAPQVVPRTMASREAERAPVTANTSRQPHQSATTETTASPEASATMTGTTGGAANRTPIRETAPSTTRTLSYPTMDPSIIPTFFSSLRYYVTTQVVARLDSVVRIYGPDQRQAVVDAALEDYPFLSGVDWEEERMRRRPGGSAAARRTASKNNVVGTHRSAGTRAATSVSCNDSTKKDAATTVTAAGVGGTSLGRKKRGRLADSTAGSSSKKTPKRARAAVTVDGEEEAGEESSNDKGGEGHVSTEWAKKIAAAGRRAARAARRSAGKAPTTPASNVGGASAKVPTRRVSSRKTPKSRAAYDSDSDGSYQPAKEKKRIYVRQKTKFEERMDQCREFKRKEGHLNIPLVHGRRHSLVNARDDFGHWAQDMRVKYRRFLDGEFDDVGRIRKTTIGNRLEELEEIGFVFEVGGEASSSVDIGQGKDDAPSSIWEWRLNECRRFKTENGNLNILSGNASLGKWADRMRGLYSQRLEGKRELSDAQMSKIRALESLGFTFDRAFDVNLLKLAAFKAREGHCRVPLTHDADRALGHWVGMVRRENNRMNRGEKSSYLTMDRMRKLNNVGFVFQGKARPDTPWEVNFDRLRKYREEHGRDPTSSHPELGSWIGIQRGYYNRKLDGKSTKIISDEREKKLRDIGFVFQAGLRPSAETLATTKEGRKKTWDDRLEEFVRWKAMHGHPYVPTVSNTEDKHLGRWVATQRQAYKALKEGKKNGKYGMLSAEKALKLANAGFAFDASHIHKTPKDGSVEVAGTTGNGGADSDQDEDESDDEGAIMAALYQREGQPGQG